MNEFPSAGRREASRWRALLTMVAVSTTACTTDLTMAQTVSPFYVASRQELAGRPGTIIRQEPLAAAVPSGTAAFRILYRSIGLHGEPLAVSGVLVVPAGPVPEDGRPVVAWQHPTSGIMPPCAPSLSPSVLAMIQGVTEMLRRGYVVVATDYPGLGTTGPHPYLVGLSEGRAVLDAVRAARNLPEAQAGHRFAVWGHSQGGHASLHAGLLARSYAPELRLVGVAAAAPATELVALSRPVPATSDSQMLMAMVMWSWSRVFDAPFDRLVAPSDLPSVKTLAGVCFDPPLDSATQPAEESVPAATYRMVQPLMDTEPWRSLAESNTPGALPPDVPVFLAQGSADTTVPPGVMADYMQRLCRAGDTVRMVVMPGVAHRFAARDAAGAAVAWMGDRFAGRPPPSDCPAGSPR